MSPRVLRSDDEIRAIAIRLPSGEELQQHRVHERTYMLVADGPRSLGSYCRTRSQGAVSPQLGQPAAVSSARIRGWPSISS